MPSIASRPAQHIDAVAGEVSGLAACSREQSRRKGSKAGKSGSQHRRRFALAASEAHTDTNAYSEIQASSANSSDITRRGEGRRGGGLLQHGTECNMEYLSDGGDDDDGEDEAEFVISDVREAVDTSSLPEQSISGSRRVGVPVLFQSESSSAVASFELGRSRQCELGRSLEQHEPEPWLEHVASTTSEPVPQSSAAPVSLETDSIDITLLRFVADSGPVSDGLDEPSPDADILTLLLDAQRSLSACEQLVSSAIDAATSGIEEARATCDRAHAKDTIIEAAALDAHLSRRIGELLCRGLADQRPDFNRQKEEPPPSWRLKVPGRPDGRSGGHDAAPSKHSAGRAANSDGRKADDLKFEDVVCSVCFTGFIDSDYNQLLYCDGCDAVVHQACYGVPLIPEGDFNCSLCSHAEELSEASSSASLPPLTTWAGVAVEQSRQAPDASENSAQIRTACCPVYHGGVKMATSDHGGITPLWVHLACCVWQDGVRIDDLTHMGPVVDISAVIASPPVLSDKVIQPEAIFQPVTSDGVQDESGGSAGDSEDIDSADGDFRCSLCGLRGGFLVSCQGNDLHACRVKFHALCGWFEGHLMVASRPQDCSFVRATAAAKAFFEKGGLATDMLLPAEFPAGVDCAAYCPSHTPSEYCERDIAEQRNIRARYRMKVPSVRPQKKKVKSEQLVRPRGRPRKLRNADGSEVDVKPLLPVLPGLDSYRDFACAVCLLSSDEGWEDYSAMGPIKAEVVSCNGCGVSVHRSCYGMELKSASMNECAEIPWTCDVCCDKAPNKAASPARCLLCPRSAGALAVVLSATETEDMPRMWAHPSCATMLAKNVLVEGSMALLNVGSHADTGSSKTIWSQQILELTQDPKFGNVHCTFCGLKEGLCVRCADAACAVEFHPLCARLNGCVSSIGAFAGHDPSDLSGIFYCRRHTPDIWEKFGSSWVSVDAALALKRSLEAQRLFFGEIQTRGVSGDAKYFTELLAALASDPTPEATARTFIASRNDVLGREGSENDAKRSDRKRKGHSEFGSNRVVEFHNKGGDADSASFVKQKARKVAPSMTTIDRSSPFFGVFLRLCKEPSDFDLFLVDQGLKENPSQAKTGSSET